MKGYSGWSYKPYYTLDESYKKNMPFIAALRPGDGTCEIEWYDYGFCQNNHQLITEDENNNITYTDITGSHVKALGLCNCKIYKFTVADKENSDRKSETRLAYINPVAGYPINYLHPSDNCYLFAGHSLCSPSIMKTKSGKLLASMDFYKYRGGQNLTKIFMSEDQGNSWNYVTDLFPCFWGKMFEHNDALYMLAMTTEYGNIIIGRSTDEGNTWTNFVTLFPGSGNRDQGGPHKAPLNIMEHHGRLWTSIDFGTWEKKRHMSGVLSVDAGSDLLDAENWTLTEFLPFDDSWEGASEGISAGCLEGNIVKLPDGNIYNFLRYQIQNCKPSYDRSTVLSIDADSPEKQLELYKIIDFVGGNAKFSITFDEVSGYYLSLSNRITDPQKPINREVLSLIKSSDGIHWTFVKDVIDMPPVISDSEACSNTQWGVTGMQYPDMIIDGNDLIWTQRTAMNRAANSHDSNYITFHRMRDFRKYFG